MQQRITHQPVQYRVLDESQCQAVYEGALRVLEQTGDYVYNERARQLLADAGCRVDGIRVWFPPHVIEDALRSAPSQALVYDREGKPAMYISAQSGKSYWGTGFENQYRVDHRTNEKHRTGKQDAYEAGLVIDALENIDLATGLCCIDDCNHMASDVYEVRMLLEATAKPIFLWQFNVENFQAQLDMCAEVAGGADHFRKKPFLVASTNSTAPLVHGDVPMEKFIMACEHNIPMCFYNSLMLGATVPVSIAGALVVGVSETLVALTVSQLVNKGCPFLAMGNIDMFDMTKTMSISMTGPENPLGAAAAVDVYRYLNLPASCHLGCTDAPVFDQQAAFDVGVDIVSGVFSGGSINMFLGYLETAMSSSLESLVYADEVLDIARYMRDGVDVSPASLALDAIDAVGPGGQFLGEPDTLAHFKKDGCPSILSGPPMINGPPQGRRILKRGPRKKCPISLPTGQESRWIKIFWLKLM